MLYGLDISKHNGDIDFKKIKDAGNGFVIIRAGYGKVDSQKDPKFETYYKQAKEVGLDVGAYWYSYAKNVSDAEKEAKCFYNAIKGKKFEYPVYIDMESTDNAHDGVSNSVLCDITETVCEYMESKGYYVGVYASLSWFNNQLKNLSKDYDKWVANWGDNDSVLDTNEQKKEYRIQQFTSTYKISGISCRFDRNVVYDYDYPEVIKKAGLNGYSKTETKPSKPSSKPSKPTTSEKYKVGDTVTYTKIYASSSSKTALNPYYKSGKITKVAKGARNPYLIGDGIGWVNDDVITKKGNTTSAIKKGDKVKIKKGAKDMNTGSTYASYVYSSTYTAMTVTSDYVVFGKNNVATGKTKKSNVTKA